LGAEIALDGLNVTGLSTLLMSINWVRVVIAILIFIVGLFIASFIRMLTYKLVIKFLPDPSSRNIARTVYYITVFIVGAASLGYLGINLTGFIIAGGIIGLIIGIALQNTVANLFSGIFILWEKPFRTGDLVRIGDVEGWVTDITIMSTRITGFDGVKIRIPNQTVFQSLIRNYYATKARRIDFVVGIAYKEDAEKAYRVIRKVIDDHPLVLVDPEPDIYVYELGNSSVNILVRVWVPSRWDLTYKVIKDLLWQMKKAISESGIEIPFIQNDIWFRTPLRIHIEGECRSRSST
jgi:small-conductance mechanosensitive channel